MGLSGPKVKVGIDTYNWYHVLYVVSTVKIRRAERVVDVLARDIVEARMNVIQRTGTHATILGVYRQGTAREYYEEMEVEVTEDVLAAFSG